MVVKNSYLFFSVDFGDESKIKKSHEIKQEPESEEEEEEVHSSRVELFSDSDSENDSKEDESLLIGFELNAKSSVHFSNSSFFSPNIIEYFSFYEMTDFFSLYPFQVSDS